MPLARRLAVAACAVPVIAAVYVSSMARGRAGRPALVGGLVLASALGSVTLPDSRTDRSSTMAVVQSADRQAPPAGLGGNVRAVGAAGAGGLFVLDLRLLPVADALDGGSTVSPGPAADSRPAAPLVAGAEVAPASPSAGAPAVNRAGGDWRWPLIGPITQRFGETLTQYGVHQGLDINGETGDPVRAARDGRVIVAGHYDACGGLDVHIDHGDGFVSWYRHLSWIETRVGARVASGELIGRVGNTGCSLGSHLHFGIQRNGEFVDPERYLPSRG
jgi:murein DD-endopeptidase MepM/ murein hydrolase activator NlpD